MIRRPPRSTLDRSSAASDVYKRQGYLGVLDWGIVGRLDDSTQHFFRRVVEGAMGDDLSLIHISEPTRPY